MKKQINSSIEKGIKFLEKRFKKDNYFGYEAIFPAILIFDCLNSLNERKELKTNLCQAIRGQASEKWSFNYWKKNSEMRIKEPYPDDLDDSCCALAAINRFNKNIIGGKELAVIINLLIICEEKEGGPYRTWILAKEKSRNWEEIDLAVNSNVAYFLKLIGIELENLINFTNEKIKNEKIESPFYKGFLPLIYFLSRWYEGIYKDKLIKILLKEVKKTNKSLDLALIISSLSRWKQGKSIKAEWVDQLIKCQNKNGSWNGSDFYFYIDKEKKSEYVGSDELSTAFVIEALALYKKNSINQIGLRDRKTRFINLLKKETEKIFNDCIPMVKRKINKQLGQFIKGDKDGVVLLTPIYIYESLNKELRNKMKKKFLVKLSLINLLGWSAYTIYDDILDTDLERKYLSIGNICFQKMIKTILNLRIKDKKFNEWVFKTIREQEEANYWELDSLKIKNQNKLKKYCQTKQIELAKRSMGHAISSVALLLKAGFDLKSKEVKNLIRFFFNFLTAKQMNDDVHDWQEDLKKNCLNSASLVLIKKLKDKKKLDILNNGHKDDLNLFFWQEIIPEYCQEMISFCDKARQNIKLIKIFDEKKFFYKIVDKIEQAANKALKERQLVLDFIGKYY